MTDTPTRLDQFLAEHPESPERSPDARLQALAAAVLDVEAAAITALKDRLDSTFAAACREMLHCRGRVIVIGMGKSGHIGGKIAATLASTGTPAFFVHPGEASHGDLGMITANDVVLALSNSGETDEINTIIPLIKRLHVPLIALTGRPRSTLAQAADVHVDVSVAQEACPLGLAPTSSTTAALAMGDAMAVSLLDARGFTAEDFARSHPGGRLGRRLLLRIDDLMHTGGQIPRVAPETLLSAALVEMTAKGLGMTAVVDEADRVIGIFTDGDLRRTFEQAVNVHETPVRDVMTARPRTARTGQLAAEALEQMERHKINALLVVDGDGKLLGALNMHDLLRAGVV